MAPFWLPKSSKIGDLGRLGGVLGHLGSVLGRLGRVLGGVLARLGGVLGASWRVLERLAAVLAPFWPSKKPVIGKEREARLKENLTQDYGGHLEPSTS